VAPPNQPSPVYVLNEGVRIFRNGQEIRFRKGIWNYSEAALQLMGQSDVVIRFFDVAYAAFVQGEGVDPNAIASNVGMSPEDLASCIEWFGSLQHQQFLCRKDLRDVVRTNSALLGGSPTGFEERVGNPRPVLFFTDTEYIVSTAKALASEIALPLDLLEATSIQELAAADLTTKTDAVEYEQSLTKFKKLLAPYACVVGCMAAPNLRLLRNLNRLLVAVEKPLILGLIDGPFMTVLSALPAESGCFECFEQRMLARLEDTAVYHEFVRSMANGSNATSRSLAPQLHMLLSTAISEAYLFTTIGMMRLAGRILNIYLPLLEIQAQDLLRVPYCPGCGFISKSQMNDMYTSSKRLLSDMMSKVEIGKS
jgi:thiazole/oxazole-forming peptide maturase SagC family component